MIAPVSTKPKVSHEPPQLRALAWLDKAHQGQGWAANGQPSKLTELGLPFQLLTPTGIDVSQTAAAASHPRFLCLWISQPAVDAQSVVRIILLGPDGNPLDVPSPDIATGAESANPDNNNNVGWLTATLCAGTMTSTPRRATIELRYSAGPWQFWDTLTADWQGFRALANGVQVTPPGQGHDGMAFVQITRDTKRDSGVEQWGFVAHTRDGRSLERSGLSQSASGNVRTERFIFDTPLSQVTHFEIRKRPIMTMVWNDVPLATETAHTLEIHADGTVVHEGKTWPSAQIKEKLKAWGREDAQRPIVLRAAPDCPYTRVTEILTACADARLTNIAFATNPP